MVQSIQILPWASAASNKSGLAASRYGQTGSIQGQQEHKEDIPKHPRISKRHDAFWRPRISYHGVQLPSELSVK